MTLRSNKRKKILIYMIGSLGDSIVTIPAFRAVRRHFSDAEIVMLQNTQAQNLVLASQVIPNELLDRCVSYHSDIGKGSKLVEYAKTWNSIRRENFDAAVYLAGSARSARNVTRDRLFFRSMGIRNLYGFHAFGEDEIFPNEANGHPAIAESEAVLKLKRISKDGIRDERSDRETPLIKITEEEIAIVAKWLSERGIGPNIPFVTIAPGCKKEVDRWPLTNFIDLGNKLCNEFPYIPVISGGESEREMGEQLIRAWGCGINAAGTFSVRESAALLSLSRLHIGLDTGTTHLAAAVGTKCFVIFGDKTNHGTWYPLGDGHTVVYHRVACAGCKQFICPFPEHPCMNGIAVDAVWRNLRSVLEDLDAVDKVHHGVRTIPI
jgi:ADP-heptose:LPS heptosyltransferase